MAVRLYSTPQCPFCVQAKRFLKENGIPFEEYDVSRNPQKADEMFRKSGQMGVPVLDVKGKILVGFRPDDIIKAWRR